MFLHLQRGDRPGKKSSREIKVNTCYEGWDGEGNLLGKVMSVVFADGKTFQELWEAQIKKMRYIKILEPRKTRIAAKASSVFKNSIW